MNLRSKLSVLICFLLLFFVTELYGQDTNFYLKNNDRVFFYGDSITEQSFYTNYVETYVVTRFPNLNISFTNAGWSGDKIWGGDGGSLQERLNRDVFPYKPTVMTAMLGMNDGCYVEFNADCFKAYTENYEKFLALVKKDSPDLRLTLLQPSPFDDWTDANVWRLAPPVKGGYNNVLLHYSQFVKELADKNNLTVADMNTPLVNLIQKMQTTNRDFAQKIIPDRIHPGSIGGLMMAAVLLDSWHAPVNHPSVSIDVSGKKQPSVKNTKVSEFKIGDGISWTQLDESLPFPIEVKDKNIALVAHETVVSNILNNQILSVSGLNEAKYTLKIDGEIIGAFSSEELTKGIDLFDFSTPMMKQAMEVQKLTEQHNKIHFARWREIQVPFEKEIPAETMKTLNALNAMEAEIVKKQRAAAQPKPHRFELIPQK